MIDFKPVNVWILVERLKEDEKKSKGGIIMPGVAEENVKTFDYKVLAISNDVFRACKDEKKDLPYKVGDIIKAHSQVGIKYDTHDSSDNRYWMKFDAAMGVKVS